MRTFEFIGAAAAMEPKVLKRFDLDVMAQIIADAEGLPERARRDDAMVEQLEREEREALEEAQAAALQTQQGADETLVSPDAAETAHAQALENAQPAQPEASPFLNAIMKAQARNA